MEEIEYIRSNKGGQKIIYRGYMYTVHKNKKCGGIRWRCAQRSLNCKGSISTTSLGIPYLNIPHNHLPDTYSTAVARNKIFDRSALDFHSYLDLIINEHPIEPLTSSVFDVTNVWEPLTEIEDEDSMPLEQRLKVPSTSVLSEPTEPVLHSQPLSPTKLKVTRQAKPSIPSPKPPTPPPPPPPIEEVCLKWNSHHSNMQNTFPCLLLREQYVDATLVAEGQTLKCHRVILSSCSPYFEDILASISPYQHPVLFMKDIPFWILKSLCDFMYAGEVHILQTKLEELLAVAETLKIKGLAGQAETTFPEVKPDPGRVIKEEKRDDIYKKDEKETKKKEEKELKKKEDKDAKKKEDKEMKKKEEKDIKRKEEKEIKKKEEKEIKPLEVKQPKRKEDKEIRQKEDKVIKEVKEKKKIQTTPLPEMPILKSSKNVKLPAQLPEMPVIKYPKPSRSSGSSRKSEKKPIEKEKIVEKVPIPKDTVIKKDILDPLDLLEPVYEEVEKNPKPIKTAVPKEIRNITVRRNLQKKIKKRKISDEREDSPPPVMSRKGTRSRPNRKVPKYFHTPDEHSTIVREPHTDQADPLMQLQCIKSELLYDVEDSIEIEDNLVGFSESSISVEEHLIENYDESTFTNYLRRNTRHSQKELQPIIMDVQSISSDKVADTLKIVNVADLRKIDDPLEDPLILNQSSPVVVEAVDNSLGFRISEVMTEKEDSRSSEVCREMGFQITNVTSEQEDLKKAENVEEEESTFTEYAGTVTSIKVIKTKELLPKNDCIPSSTSEQIENSELMHSLEEAILPITSFHPINVLNVNSPKRLEEADSYPITETTTETNEPESMDTDLISQSSVLTTLSIQVDAKVAANEELEAMDTDYSSQLNELSTSSVQAGIIQDMNEFVENSELPEKDDYAHKNFEEQQDDSEETEPIDSNVEDISSTTSTQQEIQNKSVEQQMENDELEPYRVQSSSSEHNLDISSQEPAKTEDCDQNEATNFRDKQEMLMTEFQSDAMEAPSDGSNAKENEDNNELNIFAEDPPFEEKVIDDQNNTENESGQNEEHEQQMETTLNENDGINRIENDTDSNPIDDISNNYDTNTVDNKNETETSSLVPSDGEEISSNIPNNDLLPNENELRENYVEDEINQNPLSEKYSDQENNASTEPYVQEESNSNAPIENESESNVDYLGAVSSSNEFPLMYDEMKQISSENVMESRQNCTDLEAGTASSAPGFHIAQVVSEQIAEIEGHRVSEQFANDSVVADESCEKNFNELESIVNDLSKIVGDTCGESSLESGSIDDTNSIAESLENLLQK